MSGSWWRREHDGCAGTAGTWERGGSGWWVVMGGPAQVDPLSSWEQIVFDAIVSAANADRRAPTCDELCEATGCRAVATTVNIVRRLEVHHGLIQVERFQRERRITIMETGKQTAEVRTPATHWRHRPRNVPAPSIAVLRLKKPDVAKELMVAARHEGRDLQDYLSDLVWEAWEARKAVA